MNNVQLIVGIASDIDLKELGGDRTVAKALAAIPNWRTKDNEKARKDFVRLVFWGKTAQTAARLLHKGSKIVINGRISSPFYERKTDAGTKLELSTEVVVDEFEFTGPPPQAQQEPYKATPATKGKAA